MKNQISCSALVICYIIIRAILHYSIYYYVERVYV